jgi:hypothetical protein
VDQVSAKTEYEHRDFYLALKDISKPAAPKAAEDVIPKPAEATVPKPPESEPSQPAESAPSV